MERVLGINPPTAGEQQLGTVAVDLVSAQWHPVWKTLSLYKTGRPGASWQLFAFDPWCVSWFKSLLSATFAIQVAAHQAKIRFETPAHSDLAYL
jgi:hypothetical protein